MMNISKFIPAIACCFSNSLVPVHANENYHDVTSLHSSINEDELALELYWVSEKLDGIRALWTGKKLLTRKGREIFAPDWFIQGLPNQVLEGELWAGRGNFNKVQTTVLDHKPNSEQWQNITFMLFDLPNNVDAYIRRYQSLVKITTKLNLRHVDVIKQGPIASYSALVSLLDDVETSGGEGLMLKKNISKQNDDSKPVKIKKYMDSEGVIIGYKEGDGKYKGKLGALILKLDNGKVLSVGSGLTDVLRINPPLLGESVTFRHNGYTSTGLPRFARFIRIRMPE